MLKAGWADLEFQIPVADGPELRVAAVDLPAAAARRGAVVPGIGFLPLGALFRPPNDLRVRPDEDGITPPLQLFSAAGIQDLKILPLVCDTHGFSHFLSLVVSFRLQRGYLVIVCFRLSAGYLGDSLFSPIGGEKSPIGDSLYAYPAGWHF